MANRITLARIALIGPLIAVFTWNAAWNMKAALVIFVIAAASDFLDGWVARKRGETSALGAALDPLADKLLIAASLILLVKNGVIGGGHVFAVLAIVLRELLVSGLREAVAQNARQTGALAVTRLAKAKTTFQLIAAGLFLAVAPNGFLSGDNGVRTLALMTLWIAAGLTAWTGLAYAKAAAAALSDEKREAAS